MRRKWQCILTVLIAGFVLISTFGSGFAAPLSDGKSTVPKGTDGGTSEKSYTVTLITGDKVLLETFTDGRQAVTVVPGEREGVQPTYRTEGNGEDLYVIPSDIALYVPEKLDRELFNITGLVRQGYHDKGTKQIPVIINPNKQTLASNTKLPGLDKVRTFKSIQAVSGSIDKSKASAFGKALSQSNQTSSGKTLSSSTTRYLGWKRSGLTKGSKLHWKKASRKQGHPRHGNPVMMVRV